MGIKLTTEVKEVINQMIAITKEFELEMMNTLVLLDALLLNRLFATSMEASSSCNLELISNDGEYKFKCVKSKEILIMHTFFVQERRKNEYKKNKY